MSVIWPASFDVCFMKAWSRFRIYDLTLREVQAISSGVRVAVSFEPRWALSLGAHCTLST